MKIRKIIHQTWKTHDIPREIYRAEWIESWKRCHPDWEYRFWTDADNRRLIAEHFPEFLETYDEYPADILRADAVRYFILYQYGGVYADLDYRCLRNLEPLLAGYDLVLSYITSEKAYLHGLTNAFMASRPGLALWPEVFEAMRRMSAQDAIIEFKTGPVMLKKAVRRYRRRQFWLSCLGLAPKELIKIYEPQYLCPIDHRRASLDKKTVSAAMLDDPRQLFPQAYAVTYWAHHWSDPYYLKPMGVSS